MGAFSTGLKSVANSLLTKFGQSVTINRWSTSDYNTVTGAADPMTATTYTVVAQPSAYSANEINGETIQVGDVRLIVYSTTEPLIGDIATVDSVDYRVMSVNKAQAQGDVIIYRLNVRK